MGSSTKPSSVLCRATLFALCAALTGPPTGADPLQAATAAASRDDAVLRKLEELQAEVRSLKAEVSGLRRALAEASAAAKAAAALPAPPAAISLDATDPVLGSPSATVAVVEFSDFECPYCGRFQQDTFAQLKKTYVDTGKVQYVFRDFPLVLHEHSRGAAIAAHCARRQGAYWQMRDALFAQQQRLGPELYTELAAGLKLDSTAFAACLSDQAVAAEVDRDLAYGQSVGIRGTPSFFVGRIEKGQVVDAKAISGAKPFTVFAQAIDPLLR
jgi:protein-disulfide isomerase